MFPVRVKHPEHGHMHAYNDGELDRLRALGWSPEAAAPIPAPAPLPVMPPPAVEPSRTILTLPKRKPRLVK